MTAPRPAAERRTAIRWTYRAVAAGRSSHTESPWSSVTVPLTVPPASASHVAPPLTAPLTQDRSNREGHCSTPRA